MTDAQILEIIRELGGATTSGDWVMRFGRAIAGRASNAAEPACAHVWVEARNPVVKSGEWCAKCGAIRAGNAAEPAGGEAALRAALVETEAVLRMDEVYPDLQEAVRAALAASAPGARGEK